MLATALAASLTGLNVDLVRVEVETGRGVPSFDLVGLAEAAVRESRVRVRSALARIDVDLSDHRTIVNLAPADLKKTGSAFDLAIAAATLASKGLAEQDALFGTLFIGELSLDGAVHGVRGVLPRLLGARHLGITRAVVPRDNAGEAALVRGVEVRSVATLGELAEALAGEAPLPCVAPATITHEAPRAVLADDLVDVRGQHAARRALEVAAAGGHNILFIGPPGAGKTMLARRLVGILPPLSLDEAVAATAVHSVAGLLPPGQSVMLARPFRAPHHTVSDVALVGGGDGARPGEVSLAHEGVLFLDELPEFRRSALESLRQPLEDGAVTVSRAQVKTSYPARALVVAAMNPCPCGFAGSPRCTCPDERIRAYRSRISGPLLDRLDVHVTLPPVAFESITGADGGAVPESSGAVAARVLAARERQEARQSAGLVAASCNARLSGRDLAKVAPLDEAATALLAVAAERLGLSARAYTKVLRVARTVADLADAQAVGADHVAEAIALRVLDKGAARPPRPPT